MSATPKPESNRMSRTLSALITLSILGFSGCNGLSSGDASAQNLSPEELAAIAYQAIWEPSVADLAVQAPDSFTATFETSAGDLVVAFYREWAPLGVDRVYHLTRYNFFAGAQFFRVNPGLVQFGLSGQPALDSLWTDLPIQDDPLVQSNTRGTVSFAKAGPGTRATQMFINRLDNTSYDTCCAGGFPPIGRVVSGMEVVDALFSGHGETPVMFQDSISILGNGFLDRQYPGLDSIVSTRALAPSE
jgi:peptidyl-prolyl cis-trans isomerase A (cyclophilin A)